MLKVLIVDDERPARAELTHLLRSEPLVESIAQAASVREALSKMISKKEEEGEGFDLLLLDINMPQINGMQFTKKLKAIKDPPLIIFVTAHSEYALEAFGVNAIDYLLKPVETQRLHEALYKAMSTLVSRKHLAATQVSSKRIWVKNKEGKKCVETHLIDYIEANKDLCKIHIGNEVFEKSISLQGIEQELSVLNFCLIHRGILVNVSHITGFEKTDDGVQVVLGKGDGVCKLPVARRRIHEIKTTLGITQGREMVLR